jgi:hypothetical protein
MFDPVIPASQLDIQEAILLIKAYPRNPQCEDKTCPGWFVSAEGGHIERCDECARFPSDAVAAHFAAQVHNFNLRFCPKEEKVGVGYIEDPTLNDLFQELRKP